MKEQPPEYSRYYETLVALVKFLALCKIDYSPQEKRDDATGEELARLLSLDLSDVTTVLDKFKGLFRKTIEPLPTGEEPPPTGEEKAHRYALVLRYAHREYFKAKPPPKPVMGEPLSNEVLFSLLTFIGNKVREEQENQRIRTREEEESKRRKTTNLITGFGIVATFLISLLSLIVALSK
jgi:hypothetical protein